MRRRWRKVEWRSWVMSVMKRLMVEVGKLLKVASLPRWWVNTDNCVFVTTCLWTKLFSCCMSELDGDKRSVIQEEPKGIGQVRSQQMSNPVCVNLRNDVNDLFNMTCSLRAHLFSGLSKWGPVNLTLSRFCDVWLQCSCLWFWVGSELTSFICTTKWKGRELNLWPLDPNHYVNMPHSYNSTPHFSLSDLFPVKFTGIKVMNLCLVSLICNPC